MPTIKPLNEIGFTEFRHGIMNSTKEKKAWFFTQTKTAYYADYRPRYPDRTAADITVCLDFGAAHGRLSIYGNLDALIPTIKQYDGMSKLYFDIENM